MDMKKVLFSLACLVMLAGCGTAKKAGEVSTLSEELPNTARFSNQFKVFWKDLVSEVKQSGKSLKKYKPTQEMVEYYGLVKSNNQYVLTGFIQTDSKKDDATKNFDPEKLKGMGITLNEMITGIYSFRCPLSLLPTLVNQPGMKTVEAGKQLKPLHENK